MKLLYTAIFTLFFLPHVWAAPLTVPKTFTANAPAVAADVNANFNAVKTAVNDNDSRVGIHTTALATHNTNIANNATAIGTSNANITTNATNIGANTVAIAAKGLLKVTVLNAACPFSALAVVPAVVYTKIASIGTFNKVSATSTIEAAFQGRIRVATITGSGVKFELRVNNVATTNGRARAVLKLAEVGNDGIHASMTGIFTGLPIGTHSVDMYVGGSSAATSAMWDPGCWAVDHVVIKELD